MTARERCHGNKMFLGSDSLMHRCWLGRKTIVFLLLLIGAVVLRLTFFAVSVSHIPPSADESIIMLQAGDITDGRFPLLFMAQPYLFPIESYLIAPFVKILPHNAFGARVISLFLWFLTVAVSLIIVKKNTGILTPWVAVLLTLFPSSYLLMLQAAYALPGYAALLLLGAVGVLIAICQRERSPIMLAFAGGFISALGFSANMLSLPFLLLTACYVCLGVDWRSAVKNSISFFAGCAVGLLPLLITRTVIPSAHGMVTSRYTILEALERLWSPILTNAVSPALGARICLFPDKHVISLPWLPLNSFVVIFSILLVAAMIMRIYALRRIVSEKWVRLDVQDLFVGLVLCSLMVFVFSRRAGSQSYRYLIICAWSLPFIIAYLHKSAGRLIRRLLSVFVLLWIALNIVSTVVLINRWMQPAFPVQEAEVADLKPVFTRLDELGVTYSVAPYSVAYRINYESGGRITSSQPVNERFRGWQIPYKDIVDKQTNVVYVLTDVGRFFEPEKFEQHLSLMKIECKKELCGEFVIYRDFHNRMGVSESGFLPRNDLSYSASHNTEKAPNMNDGVVKTIWTSIVPQEEKMWVQIDFSSVSCIGGLLLDYGRYRHDAADNTKIDLLTETGWIPVLADIDHTCDKFAFSNNHPVYGHKRKTVLFPAAFASALRITITKPHPPFCWTLAEVKVLTSGAAVSNQ